MRQTSLSLKLCSAVPIHQAVTAMHAPAERRRHQRFLLGLPVRVQVRGASGALTAELVDVSQSGCYFRAAGHHVPRDARVAFGFVMPERQIGLARGRVVRTDEESGFAITLDRMNQGFRSFLGDISGPVTFAA